MKICVVGLGLIGGSICRALKRRGYAVDGWNRSANSLNFALENSIIDKAAENFYDYDVVFVALPPEATLDFINFSTFKDGAVVSDICGVKKFLEDGIILRNFNYVGCHPMAGKEVSGIESSCADLFDNASMIITSNRATDSKSLETVRALTKDMGFKYIVECSAQTHDRKIAYTSQLAHIVSNAYVKDCELDGCIGFTGGSFQDMTRIAGVDENVWASLYFKNSENLCLKIENLISSLTELDCAIKSGDGERLKDILKKGKDRFDSGAKTVTTPDISVVKLK